MRAVRDFADRNRRDDAIVGENRGHRPPVEVLLFYKTPLHDSVGTDEQDGGMRNAIIPSARLHIVVEQPECPDDDRARI
jgi:hypothetical protein